MACRHGTALVLLLALTGMPVGGTLCAKMCDSSSPLAAHHGSDRKCEEPPPSASGPQMSDASGHDCATHDAAIGQLPTTAAERADLRAKSVPTAVGGIAIPVATVLHSPSPSDRSAPRDTSPPTTRPAVLRV